MTRMQTMDQRSLAGISRLADALDTTVEELLLHAPPPWTGPAADGGRLETMDETYCRRLFRTSQIARRAYLTDAGPARGLERGRHRDRAHGRRRDRQRTGRRRPRRTLARGGAGAYVFVQPGRITGRRIVRD